jgi:hypothetical protein
MAIWSSLVEMVVVRSTQVALLLIYDVLQVSVHSG